MNFLLASSRRTGGLCSRATGPRAALPRPYATSGGQAKKGNNDPENQTSFEALADSHGLGGGGRKSATAELRDLKLESKVASLFQQTLQLAREGKIKLAPADAEAQAQRETVKERMLSRLHELRAEDPVRFDDLMDTVIRDRLLEKSQSDEDGLNSGVIPGTLTPPWKNQNTTWQEFFGSIEHDLWVHTQRHAYTSTTQRLPRKHPLEYRFPWLERNAYQEKLEELDDPLTFMQKKSGLKSCQFCSPDRHQYPLEPMNVPLLTQYMTSAGFIKQRRQTALCKKHQARVARTIKQARTLGLFSYKHGSFTVKNPLDTSSIDDRMERFDDEPDGKRDTFTDIDERQAL